MKYSIIFTTVITLALTSQVVTAGSIADTYATGDTLTATKMENIKTAVNDNDGNVSTNTSNISSNTNEIGINTLGIANNASNIAAGFSGDGSAGDLITDGTATDNWLSNPPANPFFNDVIINAGETLTVPAGTTIRCTGSFTNNGTLQVLGGADNRGVQSGLAGSSAPIGMISAIAHPGDTPAAAILGVYSATSTFSMSGGPGGLAIPQATAITSFSNFRIGGGSGLSYTSGISTGGGLVKIYCTGPILNASGASILATGDSSTAGGTSGGGGGIVVLASQTSVDNADGVIDVSGGYGADSSTYAGNSGGGGGGIIVMVAPTAPVPGTDTVNTIVTGGLGGAGTTIITTESRMAGSGGGGSGGAGGAGGYVYSGTTSTPGAGGNGSPGYTITMTLDPITVAK